MPLYEYECDACGHRFERIQKFSDAPADACPKCGGSIRKLISAPAFQLKGTGWYVTDYPKEDSGGKPEEGPKDAASGDKDAKAAEKPARSEQSESGGKSDKNGKMDKSTGAAGASTSDGGSSNATAAPSTPSKPGAKP